MSEFSELLKAVGTILWPVIFAAIIWKFHEPLKGVIESARGRRFTLKVAGNELTVEEASELERKRLDDIQAKVIELQRRVDEGIQPPQASLQAAPEPESSTVRLILWVDDNPKNNTYIVAALQDKGISVITAESTDEALRMYAPGKFDRIITDMKRPEGEKVGIDLVRKIRAVDQQVPILIYCGEWAARNFKEEALAAGANGITSSSTTLVRLLKTNNRLSDRQ